MSYTQNKTSSRSLPTGRDRDADERKGGAPTARSLGPVSDPRRRLRRPPRTGGSSWLLGVFWVVISLVVLKFNQASVTTVGILTGLMFLLFAAQESVLAAVDRPRDGSG